MRRLILPLILALLVPLSARADDTILWLSIGSGMTEVGSPLSYR